MSMSPLPDEADFLDDMPDAELQALAKELTDGKQLPRPGQWRQAQTDQHRKLSALIHATAQTGRALLSSDDFHAELSDTVAVLLEQRLRRWPRPSNDQAVRDVLQALCGPAPDYLTTEEQLRFLDAIVPTIRTAIQRHAEESHRRQRTGETKAENDPLSSHGFDSRIEGSTPDTGQASFYTAEYQPDWVLRRLAALNKYELAAGAAEACRIFQFAEFAALTEKEIAACFGRSVSFVDNALGDVNHYLKRAEQAHPVANPQ